MNVENYIAQYTSLKLTNPSWFNAARQSAIEKLEEIGLPAIKDENWKYTRTTLFSKNQFELTDRSGAISFEQIKPHILTDGDVLVFIDGFYSVEFSKSTVAMPLSSCFDNAIVKENLAKIAPLASGFMAINTAMIHEGLFLHINKTIDHPIQLLHINTQPNIFNYQRNLIVLEKNTQATVIETYLSLNDSANYFNNIVTEVKLANNANLTWYKIQNESLAAQHLCSVYAQQQRDSYFKHFNIDLGSLTTRNWLQSNLMAENANAAFDGLYLIAGQQHIDNHTRVEHLAPYTFSNEHYKGILADRGRGVFNGQVYIAKDAQKVTSEQQNDNLLLTQGTEIDTKPQLEIYADDVKCTHGATIGQLNPEALFYLQSRGLDPIEAKNSLTYGFAQDITGKISYKPLADYVGQQLHGAL